MTHTIKTLEAMTRRDDWLGHGYLAERYLVEDAAQLAEMDRLVLDHANRRGLTEEQLFTWANSKRGRWFAGEYGAAKAMPWRDPQYAQYLP